VALRGWMGEKKRDQEKVLSAVGPSESAAVKSFSSPQNDPRGLQRGKSEGAGSGQDQGRAGTMVAQGPGPTLLGSGNLQDQD
jgi:hypothetical protein